MKKCQRALERVGDLSNMQQWFACLKLSNMQQFQRVVSKLKNMLAAVGVACMLRTK